MIPTWALHYALVIVDSIGSLCAGKADVCTILTQCAGLVALRALVIISEVAWRTLAKSRAVQKCMLAFIAYLLRTAE